jgi:hypothetical protein
MIGQKFAKLTVVERAGSTKQQKALWLCRCDCGNRTTVTTGALRFGTTASCGCRRKEVSVERGLRSRTIDYEKVACHGCGVSLKDRFLSEDGTLLKRLTFDRLDSLVCDSCHGDISRKNWDRKNEAGRSIVPTDVQRQVILGSILGDGCLELAPGGSNYGLSIKHGLKQEKYLLWKASLLENLVSKIDHPQERVRVRTIRHPLITTMAKDFIVDGRKTVSGKWVSEMGPLAFAVWYLDDGNLLPNRISRKGKFRKPEIRFSTNAFTGSEDEILRNELTRKVGVKTTICSWTQKTAFGIPRPKPERFFGIRLYGDNAEAFLSYIHLHVDWLESGMGYKTDTTVRGPLDNKHTRRREVQVSSP